MWIYPVSLHFAADIWIVSSLGKPKECCWNILIHLWWAYTCISIGYMPIVELLGHQNMWKPVFQNSYINFHSHWHCMRVPVAPYPCQHLIWSFFLKSCWWVYGVILLWLKTAFCWWPMELSTFSDVYRPLGIVVSGLSVLDFCSFFCWSVCLGGGRYCSPN